MRLRQMHLVYISCSSFPIGIPIGIGIGIGIGNVIIVGIGYCL